MFNDDKCFFGSFYLDLTSSGEFSSSNKFGASSKIAESMSSRI